MKPAPLVTVVINCLNGEKFLAAALTQALAQDYTNLEVLLVDNGSTDGTARLAESFLDRVRYIRLEDTVPLGAARNVAVGAARGDLVAFLDVDDQWSPDKTRLQVQAFGDESVGLVFCNGHYIRGGLPREPFYVSHSGFPSGDDLRALLIQNSLVMSACMVRRSALASIDHCFDEALHVAEEFDLFLRLCAAGWTIASVDRHLCGYVVRDDSDTFRKGRQFIEEFGRIFSKLEDIQPGFHRRYSDEILHIRDRALWAYAVSSWMSGDGRATRRALRATQSKGKKHRCLFLASWLSSPKAVRLVQVMRTWMR